MADDLGFSDLFNTPSDNSSIPDTPSSSDSFQTPPDIPPVKHSSYQADPLADAFTAFREDTQKSLSQVDVASSGKKPFNADNIASYTSQKNYTPEGFDPNDPGNNDRFAKADTWGRVIDKTFQDFGYKFTNSFMQGAYSTGRLLRSIATMGAYGINMEEDDRMKQYYSDLDNANKTNVFQTKEQDDAFFNKRFAKDFVANAGFSLGTMAEMALETVVTLGIGEGVSALSKGASVAAKVGTKTAAEIAAEQVAKSGVETAAETAGKVATEGTVAGDAAKTVEQVAADQAAKTGVNAADMAKDASKLSRLNDFARKTVADTQRAIGLNLSEISKAEGLWNKILAGAGQIPVAGDLLQSGREMARAGEAGASAMQIANIGFGGFRRGLQEMTLAVSEAAFEGVTAYGETHSALVKDFEDQNGRAADVEDMAKIREASMKASSLDFNVNVGMLLTMNKIQFGNMFSKFVPTNKIVREMVMDEAAESLEHIVQRAGMTTGHFAKGFWGVPGIAGQIADKFGKKVALQEVGKSMLKTATKFEFTEGVQELLQNIVQSGAEDYYKKVYFNSPANLADSMAKATGEQNSKMGLETFLMGAFTGGLVAGPSHIFGHIMGKINTTVSGTQEAEKHDKEEFISMIDRKNNFAVNARGIVSEHIRNMNAQVQNSVDMTEAAKQGNPYQFNNAKEDSFLESVRDAMRSNSIDAFKNIVEQTGETFTNDQFKEATGIDVTKTDYKTVKNFTKKIAEDVETYSDTHQALVRKYGPTIDPYIFPKDSTDFMRSKIAQQTLYDAIDIMAMSHIKGNMTGERAKKLMGEIVSVKELGASSDYAMRVLTDVHVTEAERGQAQSEISNLTTMINNTTDPETKKQLTEQRKGKEQEREALQTWISLWHNTNAGVMEQNTKGEERQPDWVYVGKADKKKIANKTITDAELEKGLHHKDVANLFTKILNLKNKQAGLSTTIPGSISAENFGKVVDYMRLSNYSKKHLNTVEMLSNPDYFLKVHMRMADGYFRASLSSSLGQMTGNILRSFSDELYLRLMLQSVNELNNENLTEEEKSDFHNDILQKVDEARARVYDFITTSTEFVKLHALLTSNTEGVEMHNYALTLITSLEEKITALTDKELGKEPKVTEPVKEPVVEPVVKPTEVTPVEVSTEVPFDAFDATSITKASILQGKTADEVQQDTPGTTMQPINILQWRKSEEFAAKKAELDAQHALDSRNRKTIIDAAQNPTLWKGYTWQVVLNKTTNRYEPVIIPAGDKTLENSLTFTDMVKEKISDDFKTELLKIQMVYDGINDDYKNKLETLKNTPEQNPLNTNLSQDEQTKEAQAKRLLDTSDKSQETRDRDQKAITDVLGVLLPGVTIKTLEPEEFDKIMSDRRDVFDALKTKDTTREEEELVKHETKMIATFDKEGNIIIKKGTLIPGMTLLRVFPHVFIKELFSNNEVLFNSIYEDIKNDPEGSIIEQYVDSWSHDRSNLKMEVMALAISLMAQRESTNFSMIFDKFANWMTNSLQTLSPEIADEVKLWTPDSVKTMNVQDMYDLLQGEPIKHEVVPEVVTEEKPTSLFKVTSENGGYTVRDENGTEILTKKDKKRADDIAQAFNDNVDFTQSALKMFKDKGILLNLYSEFRMRVRFAQIDYNNNKNTKTKVDTLEQYTKTASYKKVLKNFLAEINGEQPELFSQPEDVTMEIENQPKELTMTIEPETFDLTSTQIVEHFGNLIKNTENMQEKSENFGNLITEDDLSDDMNADIASLLQAAFTCKK